MKYIIVDYSNCTKDSFMNMDVYKDEDGEPFFYDTPQEAEEDAKHWTDFYEIVPLNNLDTLE